MTLHWWMHWFWITCLTLHACVCNPTPATLSSASEEGGHISLVVAVSTAEAQQETASPAEIRQPSVSNTRAAKAIGHFPKSTIPILPTPQPPDLRAVSVAFPQLTKDDGAPSLQSELSIRLRIATTLPPAVTTPINEDTNTTVATQVNVTTLQPIVAPTPNNTTVITNDTVIEAIDTEVKKSNESNVSVAGSEDSPQNESSILPLTIPFTPPSVNESTETEELEVSTAKALSLETAVERRAASNNVVSGVASHGINNGGGGRLDAASVAGICFGCLVVVALSGAIGFVLYRRRYLNKPQTLNDKCSNPDSSGYIDDSTIRENSEEMYSLDNDSFLNSLEAMTIQNYWTDSVKHTKL